MKRWTFSAYPSKKLYARYTIVLTVAPKFFSNFVVYQNWENCSKLDLTTQIWQQINPGIHLRCKMYWLFRIHILKQDIVTFCRKNVVITMKNHEKIHKCKKLLTLVKRWIFSVYPSKKLYPKYKCTEQYSFLLKN